jgi:hypothetical protein
MTQPIPVYWHHDRSRPAGTVHLDLDSVATIERLVDTVPALSPAFRRNADGSHTLIEFGIVTVMVEYLPPVEG